jgi:hypothetical protein
MCVLPKFNVSVLKEVEKTKNCSAKKNETVTMELLVSERILENQS